MTAIIWFLAGVYFSNALIAARDIIAPQPVNRTAAESQKRSIYALFLSTGMLVWMLAVLL